MPGDDRSPRTRGATRRQLLRAVVAAPAAVGANACSVRLGQPATEPSATRAGADEPARERAAAAADLLATRARATAAMRPDASLDLTRIAAEHEAHARALRPAPTAATIPTTTASPTTSPAAATPAPPSALISLAAAERAAASTVEADLPAVSGPAARLLASVMASRLVHAEQLTARPRARQP